ncbi:MAG: MerR family transcriptional regulator [Firmicutes bacterium]|nr:MerR family transcriptional regulator [Candidatus Fermentithermobacillaceae bacterium]
MLAYLNSGLMDVRDKRTPVYAMGTVSRLTGLSPRQIRYYDKLGLVTPFRTEGGHRLYSQQDVDDLLFVKDLFERGYLATEIREEMSKRNQARKSGSSVRPVAEMDASFRFNSLSEPSSVFPMLKRPEVLKKVRPRGHQTSETKAQRQEDK